MNNSDHISEILETVFWVKNLKFFDADPGSGLAKFGAGSGMGNIRIWNKHPGSATLLTAHSFVIGTVLQQVGTPITDVPYTVYFDEDIFLPHITRLYFLMLIQKSAVYVWVSVRCLYIC